MWRTVPRSRQPQAVAHHILERTASSARLVGRLASLQSSRSFLFRMALCAATDCSGCGLIVRRPKWPDRRSPAISAAHPRDFSTSFRLRWRMRCPRWHCNDCAVARAQPPASITSTRTGACGVPASPAGGLPCAPSGSCGAFWRGSDVRSRAGASDGRPLPKVAQREPIWIAPQPRRPCA